MSEKNYLELTEEQKLKADKLYYLLGKDITEPLFSIRNNQVIATKTIFQEGPYEGDWGSFCYACRTGVPTGQVHECQISNKFIYPIRLESDLDRLLTEKTLREKYAASK